MNSEVIDIIISDIGETVTGKTPSSSLPEDFGNEFMFITPSDEFDRKYINTTNRYLSNIGYNRLKSKSLKPYSVLVSCIGSAMGKVTMNSDFAITNQQINSIIVNEEKYSSHYVYYLLKNNYNLLRNAASGSTALPLLNKSDFDELRLKVHSNLSTQQKIAAVLSALDDKIEVNNKINAELEAMAKTLYDYWFVQFEFPNAEGKPYKSSGGKMVYNSTLKREIPEGWEVKSLEDIENNIITGKTPSTRVEDNFDGDIPFVTIDDIRKQLYIYNSERTLSKKGADSQITKYLEKGDICVSCIGTVGVIGIVGKTCQTNQQINSISKIKDYNRYFLLNNLKMYFEFNNAAKQGAVLQNMNKGEFSSIPILDASIDVKIEYFKKVKDIYDRIEINLKQNQELSQLRDWLLPMLMNGQVTVV